MPFFMTAQRFSYPDIFSALFLAGAFLFAVFFHGTQDSLYGPLIIFLSVGGCLALYNRSQTGWLLPGDAFPAALGMFWIYLALSVLWSQTPYISLYFFFIFSIAPFLFFVLAGTRRATLHIGVTGAAIAALTLWALIQFFFLYDQYGPRIRHPFLDPNGLAGLINLGLAPAMAVFITAQERWKKAATAALLCLLYAALVATQSRAGILAAGVSALMILPFLARPLRDKKNRLAALLAVAAIIPLLLREYSELLHHRDLAKAILGGGSGSMADRTAIWHATWTMIREHLWGGTGLGSFPYFYGAHRLPTDRSDGYFAHMDPLQLWAETGATSFVLFYAVIGAALTRTIRAILRTDDIKTRAAILGPFGGMAALILHTHLNYHLYMPALQIPLGVLMVAWYAATAPAFPDQKSFLPSRSANIALAAACAFALLAANIWCARAAISSHYIGASARALNAGDIAAAKKNAAGAAFWGPRSKPQPPQYEARWRILELQQNGSKMPQTEKLRLYNDAMTHINEALDRQAQSSFLLGDRARLFLAGESLGLAPGGYARATADLDTALAMDPVNVGIRMDRAALSLRNGELQAGLKILEEGLRWPRPKGQADINFLVMTARLRKQLGDDRGHDQLIAVALERAKAYGLTRPARNRP